LAAGSVRAFTHVAFCREQKGRLGEAERLYLRGVDAGDPQAMNMLACMLMDNEDFERAEVYFNRAIERGYLTAIGNLARMLHRQRRWVEGGAALRSRGWGGRPV
jgi:Flp pilus assembly protein TadD